METGMQVVKSWPGRPSECVIHSPERTDLGSAKMRFCWAVMQSRAAMNHVTEHFHGPCHTEHEGSLGQICMNQPSAERGSPVHKAICCPAFNIPPCVSTCSLPFSPGWVHYFLCPLIVPHEYFCHDFYHACVQMITFLYVMRRRL